MELFMFGVFAGLIIATIIFGGGVVYGDWLDKESRDRDRDRDLPGDMDSNNDSAVGRHNMDLDEAKEVVAAMSLWACNMEREAIGIVLDHTEGEADE